MVCTLSIFSLHLRYISDALYLEGKISTIIHLNKDTGFGDRVNNLLGMMYIFLYAVRVYFILFRIKQTTFPIELRPYYILRMFIIRGALIVLNRNHMYLYLP